MARTKAPHLKAGRRVTTASQATSAPQATTAPQSVATQQTTATTATTTTTVTKTFLDFPQEVRDIIYEKYIKGFLPGKAIVSPTVLKPLSKLCRSHKTVRADVVSKLRADFTIHGLNQKTYLKIMTSTLGGMEVRDMRIKATYVYYWHGGPPRALEQYLKELDWEGGVDNAMKKDVVKHFGVRNPGDIRLVKMEQKIMKDGNAWYKFSGEKWKFDVTFGEIEKYNLGAAFEGDLGRLTFLEARQDTQSS